MPTPTPDPADGHGLGADHAAASSGLHQVQRGQARVYVDLAGRMPRWYFLAVAGVLALLISSYDLGPGLAQFALTQVSLFTLIALVFTLRRRNGISGLRLRGLSGTLRRAFVPLAVFGLVAVPLAAFAIWTGVSDPERNISFLSLGVAYGVAFALTAIWSWRRFSAEAERLADAVGADR